MGVQGCGAFVDSGSMFVTLSWDATTPAGLFDNDF